MTTTFIPITSCTITVTIIITITVTIITSTFQDSSKRGAVETGCSDFI